MKVSWSWPNVLLAYLGLFCFSVLDNFRGPFFPEIIKDLQISNTQASLIFVVPSLFAVLGSQFVPKLVKKWNSIIVLRLSLLLLGLPFMGFLWIQSLSHLLILSSFFGIGLGMLQVAQHLVVQDGAQPEQLRKLFSGLHSVYAGAAFLAPLFVSFFIQFHIGWREGFLLVGLLPLLLLIFSFTLNYRIPECKDENITAYKVHRGQFIYVALMVSFYMAGEIMLSSRLVFYMQSHFKVTPTDSQYYLFAFFLGLFAGRILFTIYPLPRFELKKLLVIFLFLSTITVILGLTLNPWLLSLSGLMMSPTFAIFMNYLSVKYKHLSSSAMAYAMGFGALTIVAMHYSVGYFTDVYGIHKALYLGPFFLSGSMLLILGHEKFFSQSLLEITSAARSE